MKTVFRKMLSVMLALCLCTALMPFSVLAAEGDVCEIVETGVGYPTLDGALGAVQSGETIRLSENINYNGGIVIEDKRITFELNGCTLNVVNPADTGTVKDTSGLYVKGDAAVALSGAGEFNVTGAWYGVYAASTDDETDSVTNNNTSVTVTNALGHEYAGVMANNAKVTVKGNADSDGGGYGVKANFQYAEVTVEGNVTASGDGCAGVLPNSSAKITVKGSVTVSGDYSIGTKAYDEGEVTVEKDVTANGAESVGIYAPGSYVTVGGNVTGEYGGVEALASGVYITGDVRSLGVDENSYGVKAMDNCEIDVGGDVLSNGTGVYIWSEGGEASSEITIDGVIEAPEYIRIGSETFAVADGSLDPEMIAGYRIYTDPSLGAVLVAEFAGGSGSEEDPYLIAHADQLYNVRNHLDKCFRLIEDIDLDGFSSGEGWEPIGDNSTPFTGVFDGGAERHTISGLVINRSISDYEGLFGYTGETAEIRNLGLVEVNVTGRDYVGGLTGWNNGLVTDTYVTGDVTGDSDVGGLAGQNEGVIIDSYFTGTVTADYYYTGGLVGDNNGTITNCHTEATVTSSDDYIGGLAGGSFGPITGSYAAGTVKGDDYVGGLVGWNYSGDGNNGEITASYSTCTVEGTWDVGGLVGDNSGLIANSFATGMVTGEIDIGGLAGSNYSSITNSYAIGGVVGDAAVGGLVGYNTASINNCYAIGAVEGGDDVGGLVGDNGSSDSGTAANSYWDTETSGLDISDGGAGKTTAEMKQQETYDDWDFEEEEIWGINESDNNGYPFLKWQGFVHEQTDVPPVLSETGASSITAATATLDFTSDKAGTYYYLVYAATEAAPDAAAIKAQGEAAAKGTGIAAAAANAVEATGLTASTAYKAYVIIEDAEENISNVAVIGFTTTAEAVQTYALTITAGTGGSITTGSSGNYAAGTVITIAATPSSGYSFDEWSSAGGGSFGSTTSAGTTFTMPANAVTITAGFTYNGSGGGSHTSTTSYKADVTETGIAKTTLPVNVNTNTGSATTDLGNLAGDIFTGEAAAVITVPSIPRVDTYILGISASSLSGTQGEGSLTFATGIGSINIPDNMLSGIPGSEGEKAGITIGQGDKSALPDEVKAAVGDRPLVQLTLTLDGTQTDWNNPEAPVTVSIPYSPTANELADPEHIVVWYIDGAGNAVSVYNGRYDPATGAVTFSTTHFSYYAIAYVQKTFGDLESVIWAKEPIEALASKGILEGTSKTEYSPQENVTRADFLCFLVRTLGVDAEVDGNFDDISSDAYYYKEIGIAKKLGLTSGTGNNKFSPDACITRQDMMVLTARALRMLKKLEAQGSDADLDRFADKSLVAAYAVNSVASVVKEGLITGSGDKLNPLGNTTRAEAAVFLYRVYNR